VVSPEYQEQLDNLAESLRADRELAQAEIDFERVFVPIIPLSFFQDIEYGLPDREGEALPPSFIQHRFEDLQ